MTQLIITIITEQTTEANNVGIEHLVTSLAAGDARMSGFVHTSAAIAAAAAATLLLLMIIDGQDGRWRVDGRLPRGRACGGYW